MIPGLREDSLYYQAYYRLRQPLLQMLFDGVAWDQQSAEEERAKLAKRKEEVKDRLDHLTGGVRLYTLHRNRSDRLKQLLFEQRELRASKDGFERGSGERKAAIAEIKQIQQVIRECRSSGGDVVVSRGDGLSDKAISCYLYGPTEPDREYWGEWPNLGLPTHKRRRKETGKLTITVDNRALLKLAGQYPQHAELIQLILEHRRCEKLISTYLNPEKLLGWDGRFHSMYKPFGTQTGRLASGEDPWKKGGNAQNIDRSLKWLFKPDL